MFADENTDSSNEALYEMYCFETYGEGDLKSGLFSSDSKPNAFANGKHWMDVTIQMWREGIEEGLLSKEELYEDKYPKWWLDKVLNGVELDLNKFLQGFLIK